MIRPFGTCAPILAVLATLLAGCESEAQRKAAENAALRKQGSAEVKRICSLPGPERDAEIKKVREQSGAVLYCAD